MAVPPSARTCQATNDVEGRKAIVGGEKKRARVVMLRDEPTGVLTLGESHTFVS